MNPVLSFFPALLGLETPLQEFLQREWFGNPATSWLRAAIVLLSTFLVLGIVKRLVVARLAVVAQRTSTDIDDLVVDLIKRTKRWFLCLVAAWVAHHFIQWPRTDSDGDGVVDAMSRWERAIEAVVWIAIWVQVGLWGRGLVQYGLRAVLRQRGADPATASMGVTVLSFLGSLFVWSLVVLLCLEALHVEVTSLIASLGVGGIAVALAAQNILGDLFASIAILLDKPFIVGDGIQLGEFQGTVERIGIKTTRLRSLNGEEIVISNTDLVTSRIRNFKRLEERRIVTMIGVVYETPHDVVAAIPGILRAIVEATPTTRFDRAHFKSFGDSALLYELVYFAQSTEFTAMMDAQQTVNLEIHRQFEARGIDFAYPTQTVHHIAHPPAEDLPRGATRVSS